MPNREIELLPDVIAEQAIAEIQKYIDGELGFDELCRRAKRVSSVTWYRALFGDLADYAEPHLPDSPQGSPDSSDDPLMAAERVMMFLRCGRVYDDGRGPVARVLGWLFAIVLLGGSVVFMSLGFVKEFVFQVAWIDRAINAVAISVAVCLGILFCFYSIGCLLAGVHIFRVRILRQDLTPKPDSDIWPYLDREDYERDRQVAATSS